DPIGGYAERLEHDGVIAAGEVDRLKHEVEALVNEQARAVIDAPWPDPAQAGRGVFAGEPPRRHVEVLDPDVRLNPDPTEMSLPVESGFSRTIAGFSRTIAGFSRTIAGGSRTIDVEAAPPFDPKGKTLLEGVMLGSADALRA